MIRKVKTANTACTLAAISQRSPTRCAAHFSCCWGSKTRAGRVEFEKASRASQNNRKQKSSCSGLSFNSPDRSLRRTTISDARAECLNSLVREVKLVHVHRVGTLFVIAVLLIVHGDSVPSHC